MSPTLMCGLTRQRCRTVVVRGRGYRGSADLGAGATGLLVAPDAEGSSASRAQLQAVRYGISNIGGVARPMQLQQPLAIRGMFYRWDIDLAGPLPPTAPLGYTCVRHGLRGVLLQVIMLGFSPC
jgi:hypothetical protein